MLIWGVIWIITAFIASGVDESFFFIVPVLYWTWIGSAITDLIVEKDWHGLIRFLIISTLIIVGLIILSLYWD